MNIENYMNEEFFKENVNKSCSVNHRVEEREYWERFKGEFFKTLEGWTQGYEDAFKILPASKHMLFKTEGDRATFEGPYFNRRKQFVRLAYMEAIENEGKYFNDILDLLWAILEESVWTPPAHQHYSSDDCLPHELNTALDLFSGETAALVSMVYYIFKNKFDAISSEIGERIKRRVRSEIYENFINNDYKWMGYGRIPNNWNPWIISNVVRTIINLEEYGELEYKTLARSVFIINKYFSHYPEDGGCDEGVVYWGHAGGCFIIYADCMKRLTNGKFDLTSLEKTKNMARFTVSMYNCNDYIMNFSDCAAKTTGNWAFMYYVGKVMNDSLLISYAKANYEATKNNKDAFSASRVSADRSIYIAEAMTELPDVEGTFELPYGCHFDSIKVMLEREKTTEPYGLVLAAKASHNGESHNHLDVGNIIVFKNTVPFVVDAGNKTYTAQTFSERRYEIWNTNSFYHNLPVIGGEGQKRGKEFAAENVVFENSSMKADLENVYGCDFINKFTRMVSLDRESSQVVLTDFIDLAEEKEVIFTFMTPADVEISDKIILKNKGEVLEISVNKPFEAEVEKIEDNDPNVIRNWDGTLKRIRLKAKFKSEEYKFIMR